jgi:hypothetical protein
VKCFGARSGFLLVAILALVWCLSASAQNVAPKARADHSGDSLAEIRDKQRALLIVFRSNVLDAANDERAIIDLVLKANPQPRGRYQWVYGALARRLNAYIRKHQSMTAAHELGDADYVIFFDLLEYRRILNTVYPFGELFVIIKGSPDSQKPPRVIWRSRKAQFAQDAISELIRELKLTRGED